MNNSEERKLTRLQELEINEDFQKLPEDKKVILIAGEKILEMDQYFKNMLLKLNQQGSVKTIFQDKNFLDEILKLVDEKLDSSLAVKKEDILELIDQRYNEEMLALENKYQFTTQQAIKNIDESFGEALQRVENLSQFQIQAREEIRKTQDKIYILEEELSREKEKNESLKKIVDDSIEKQNMFHDDFSLLNNYEFFGKEFNSFDDLKNFIREESRSIAENEIEKYLHDKDIFSNESIDEIKTNSHYDKKVHSDEILKIYSTQISNGNKLDDLEKLINKQNEEMKLLSEERKNMVLKIAGLIRTNKIKNSSDLLSTFDNKDIEKLDSFVDFDRKGIFENPNKVLSDEEIEFLIKNEAIELVKDRLNELSNKSDEEINALILKDIKQKESNKVNFTNHEIISEDGKKQLSELEKVNSKIVELQKQLRNQINQNENLKDQLFDELLKNSTNPSNNGIINSDYINFAILDDEDFMSKHNYYDGKFPSTGTKITRINNYRINNDLGDNQTTNTETHEIIKTEVENLVKNNPFESEVNDFSRENNQKIIDLESIVQKQEEEINRLKTVNSRETTNIENINFTSNSNDVEKQNQFMRSLEQTLFQLKELSNIQAQTVADLEKQSKKLEEMEQKVKNEEINDKFITHENLDRFFDEKYKMQKSDEDYYLEIKKVEDERRKIEEALDLERMRLISEINSGKNKLNEISNKNTFGQKQEKNEKASMESPKQDVVLIETPKKKRKQQVFYEVKVHNRPKLTRADIEK